MTSRTTEPVPLQNMHGLKVVIKPEPIHQACKYKHTAMHNLTKLLSFESFSDSHSITYSDTVDVKKQINKSVLLISLMVWYQSYSVRFLLEGIKC